MAARPANFKITGGRTITGIEVLDVTIVRLKDGPGGRESDEDDVVALRVDKEGDFSRYTLEFVNAPGSKRRANTRATAPPVFQPRRTGRRYRGSL